MSNEPFANFDRASARLRHVAKTLRAGDSIIRDHVPAPPGHDPGFMIRDLLTMADWLEQHEQIDRELGAEFINLVAQQARDIQKERE